MANHDPRTETHEMNLRLDPNENLYDAEISLKPLVRTLWSYRRVIAAAVSAIFILFLLGALGVYLYQPAERQASLEFQLLFEGADKNQYPNGLAFSRGDIINTTVLARVYEANDLQRYCTYDQFKNGIFILESSRDLELLELEYRAKLADTRLTPVDRSKLEGEFRQKQEAMHVPRYTLNFMSARDNIRVPNVLMSKLLNDILVTWAEEAAKRKGILSYQVKVYTTNVLSKEFLQAEDYIVSVDMLRDKIGQVLENIDELVKLPGATLIRVGNNRISLPEIRTNLEDIRRFRVEPLIGIVRTTGVTRDPVMLSRYLEGRLFQVKLDDLEAARRVATVQEGLRNYMSERSTAAMPSGQEKTGGFQVPPTLGTPAVIPQFGESFLNSLMTFANQNSDVQYRQKLTDQIIAAGQARASLQTETAYYEDMLASIRRLPVNAAARGAAPNREAVEAARIRFDEIYKDVVRALEQINSVYEELSSQNLNPRTNLYTITGPFLVAAQRTLTFGLLALYALMTLMLSLLLVPLACIIYHYFHTEILPHWVNTASKEPHSDGDSAGRTAEEEAVVPPVETPKKVGGRF